AEAAAATERQLALGPSEGAGYANLAELLMATGRIPEAEDRYREAIRTDSESPERRLRERSLALSYYGLGVALDRDGQAAAAREMIGRALALDPGIAMLQLALKPGGDVTFEPPGDVHYYLALAHEVAGRAAESEDAFRAFLAARPGDRWEKAARAHLGALDSQRKRRSARGALRVLATATTHASGPIPAPLIDAAWRRRPNLIDGCLARLATAPAGHEPFRVPLDLELDARGALTRATVPRPTDLDAAFVDCVEQSVRAGLVVLAAPAPAPSTGNKRKSPPGSTLARLELLIGD
ncbi:MAG TPA: tetratricopeptide repeat protein, partial [Polyangia bacterium]|nr:tetratricopeptide repeat protein [Polyangia bacterium]